MQFQGGASTIKCTEKMLQYIKTINFGQMPKSTREVLFKLDFSSWHPLVCVRYSNFEQ